MFDTLSTCSLSAIRCWSARFPCSPPRLTTLAFPTFVVLELISARMTCIGGCLPQTFSSCANEDVLAEASNQIVEVLVQATFQEFLSQFHIVNQIASIARCGLDSDMPPVEVVYSTDFSQVERLTFSQSVWGKYMFRIQSLAGTVS